MAWGVYILECGDGSLYTGITNDLSARLEAHESGKGAKYTKGRGPFTLLYYEECGDRSRASKRERVIKGLKREEKMELCRSQ
ncbi:MAG: GIY-YIG nuclease family protein [Rhodospirillales bacterium]|nr:GIY-YIG nuclease family protein [Alphaproteobacteria bacterium]USO04448.1 MAG: GIY-YIG nuclease family protein [Rhodospirillales bacterium]